jgi:hypothetical protein
MRVVYRTWSRRRISRQVMIALEILQPLKLNRVAPQYQMELAQQRQQQQQ